MATARGVPPTASQRTKWPSLAPQTAHARRRVTSPSSAAAAPPVLPPLLIAIGSLFTYGPFLVVKIPLVGAKLLRIPNKSAYDRAGNLRRVMNRRQAYDKWCAEQAQLEKELARVRRQEQTSDLQA